MQSKLDKANLMRSTTDSLRSEHIVGDVTFEPDGYLGESSVDQ
jgi:hypothetical protein